MIRPSQLDNTPMGEALKELSIELNKAGHPPISLNVVGGFALMLHNKRDLESITDIDYVGPDMSDTFNNIAEKIGQKHNMGRHWINNDVIMSGMDLEDFEFSTGKLHFEPAMTIGDMQINILNEQDLLRMKVIAIDTSLTALTLNGDFTRFKDMSDVKNLIESSGKTRQEIFDEINDYIINPQTKNIIECYLDYGTDATKDAIALITEQKLKTARENRMQTNKNDYVRSPFIENLLNNLTKSSNDNHFEI